MKEDDTVDLGGEYHFFEEKIQVTTFHTSDDLKSEIGRRIKGRMLTNWDFVDLTADGPFLRLMFRQRIN